MTQRLKNSDFIVGAKQTTKAVQEDLTELVYLALNADVHITDPIRKECLKKGISIVEVDTMEKLGKACSIEVKAAVACLLKSTST